MEKDIKFEKALERLETIVEDLESGNMPLDESLKKYEEGVKLSRACTKELERAETKIEMLSKALNGLTEVDGGDGSAPQPKKVKRASKATQEASDLLL